MQFKAMAAAFATSLLLGTGLALAQQQPPIQDAGFTLTDDDEAHFENGDQTKPFGTYSQFRIMQALLCLPGDQMSFAQVFVEASKKDLKSAQMPTEDALAPAYVDTWRKIKEGMTKDDFTKPPSAKLQAALQKHFKAFTDKLEQDIPGVHFRVTFGAYLLPQPGCVKAEPSP